MSGVERTHNSHPQQTHSPKKLYMRSMRIDTDVGSAGEDQCTPDTSEPSMKSSGSTSDQESVDSTSIYGEHETLANVKNLASPWTPPSWGSILSPGTPGGVGEHHKEGGPVAVDLSSPKCRGMVEGGGTIFAAPAIMMEDKRKEVTSKFCQMGNLAREKSGRTVTPLHKALIQHPTDNPAEMVVKERETSPQNATNRITSQAQNVRSRILGPPQKVLEQTMSESSADAIQRLQRMVSSSDSDSGLGDSPSNWLVSRSSSLTSTTCSNDKPYKLASYRSHDQTAGNGSAMPGSWMGSYKDWMKTGAGQPSRPGQPKASQAVSKSASHTLTQSASHTLTQSASHTLTQPASHTITQSASHTLTQPASHTITQSASDTLLTDSKLPDICDPDQSHTDIPPQLPSQLHCLPGQSHNQPSSQLASHSASQSSSHTQNQSTSQSDQPSSNAMSDEGKDLVIEEISTGHQEAMQVLSDIVTIKEEVPDPGYETQVAEVGQSEAGCVGEIILCQVCGDLSAGFHCGAFVCEACKKFFVRCVKCDTLKFTCPRDKQCVVNRETRTQCQYCRYQKCLTLGMYRPGGANVSSEISHMPCSVCGAPSSGYHFGAITCEGCKGFFRRTVKERDTQKYHCGRGSMCTITTSTRNVCKFCRYRKCLDVGMKSDGSRIGRQPNSVKHATMIQLQQIKMAKGISEEAKPKVTCVTGNYNKTSSGKAKVGEIQVGDETGGDKMTGGEGVVKPRPVLMIGPVPATECKGEVTSPGTQWLNTVQTSGDMSSSVSHQVAPRESMAGELPSNMPDLMEHYRQVNDILSPFNRQQKTAPQPEKRGKMVANVTNTDEIVSRGDDSHAVGDNMVVHKEEPPSHDVLYKPRQVPVTVGTEPLYHHQPVSDRLQYPGPNYCEKDNYPPASLPPPTWGFENDSPHSQLGQFHLSSKAENMRQSESHRRRAAALPPSRGERSSIHDNYSNNKHASVPIKAQTTQLLCEAVSPRQTCLSHSIPGLVLSPPPGLSFQSAPVGHQPLNSKPTLPPVHQSVVSPEQKSYSLSPASQLKQFSFHSGRPEFRDVRADVPNVHPEVLNVHPEVHTVQRKVQHVQPEVQHVWPEVKHVQPEVHHVQPDVQHVQPDVQHVQPEVQHVQPEVQHVCPEVQNMDPASVTVPMETVDYTAAIKKTPATPTSAKNGKTYTTSEVLSAVQNAYRELMPVLKRCPDIPTYLVTGLTIEEGWDVQMKQFSQCAMATLKFAKKIPGFKSLTIPDQIRRVQESMYPIVIALLSTGYDLDTRQYNYFNMTREEEEVILNLFPEFRTLVPTFHIAGFSVRTVNLDNTEVAFLCALKLMSAVEDQYLEDILVAGLEKYCEEKLMPITRAGEVILRLGEMSRVNIIHQKTVINMSDRLKQEGLQIPQLFEETFLNVE